MGDFPDLIKRKIYFYQWYNNIRNINQEYHETVAECDLNGDSTGGIYHQKFGCFLNDRNINQIDDYMWVFYKGGKNMHSMPKRYSYSQI